LRKRFEPNDACAMEQGEQRESIKDEMRTVIEEARMVLPGVQALFGFQLIAVFNSLSHVERRLHLLAMALVALTIVLIMAPAAFHRIAKRGWVSRRLIDTTSNFLTASMAVLMVALSVEFGLVGGLILRDTAEAFALGGALFLGLLVCWVILPLRFRRHR
jgi:hypothetical protein